MATVSGIGAGALSGAGAGAALGPWGAAAGAVVGGVLGALQSSDNADQAQANIQAAIARLEGMGIPPDTAMPLILQKMQEGGKLTPAYEQALQNVGASQLQENPQDKQNIQATLSVLQGMTQGGLNPEQQANAQALQQKTNANAQAQIAGLLQQQAQQGKSGSGDTLAAQLQAVQSGAQNLSQGNAAIAGQGFQAQQQALGQLLSGQSNLRQQDIGVLGQNAQLSQQANLFNAQNSNARQARNVASENSANAANWGRTNQVNDANTMMANQELIRQRQAQQQDWQNQMALAQAKANAELGAGSMYGQMANNQNQNYNQTLQGATTMGAAYMQSQKPAGNNYYGYPGSGGSTDYGSGINNIDTNANYAMPTMGSQYAEGGAVQQPDPVMVEQKEQPMGQTNFMSPYARGGQVPPPATQPVMLNSYGAYAEGGDVSGHTSGRSIREFVTGGHVPGTPMFPGNNYANDTVKAVLSPGEIVVPNSASHDPEKAKRFVEDEIYKNAAKMHGPVFQHLHERLRKVEGKKAK